MVFPSGLGIVLSLVFGFLLLALIAELYYLLWWKKLKHNHQTRTIIQNNHSNHTKKELSYYLFCWKKPPPSSNPTNTSHQRNLTTHQATTTTTVITDPSSDIEIGASKEFLLRAFEGTDPQELDGIESELMRLHNLSGPPRFLFTIKEETKEDLESDDGGRSHKRSSSNKGSRTKSNLGDLIPAIDDNNPFSPLPSPPLIKVSTNNQTADNGPLESYSRHGINPLFESVWVDAELDRLRSSPPPKFKFLREAEEKLYKRLLEEAEKINSKSDNNSGVNSRVQNLGITEDDEDGKDDSSSLIKVTVGKSNHQHHHHIHHHHYCHSSSSQVLPLSCSPPTSKLSHDGCGCGSGGGGESKPVSD